MISGSQGIKLQTQDRTGSVIMNLEVGKGDLFLCSLSVGGLIFPDVLRVKLLVSQSPWVILFDMISGLSGHLASIHSPLFKSTAFCSL